MERRLHATEQQWLERLFLFIGGMVIDGRYPANQSRLVVSPMIYKVYKQYIATSLDHFLKDMGAQVFVFRGFCFL